MDQVGARLLLVQPAGGGGRGAELHLAHRGDHAQVERDRDRERGDRPEGLGALAQHDRGLLAAARGVDHDAVVAVVARLLAGAPSVAVGIAGAAAIVGVVAGVGVGVGAGAGVGSRLHHASVHDGRVRDGEVGDPWLGLGLG